MIIGVKMKLETDKIYDFAEFSCLDVDGYIALEPAKFMVIREATKDEFINCCLALEPPCNNPVDPGYTHFYLVSTD